MKKIVYFAICALALSFAACEYDNYDKPESRFSGRILYNGEQLGFGYNEVYIELWEQGDWQLKEAIRVNVNIDGTFSQVLFDVDYKMVIPKSARPFLVEQDTVLFHDSIEENLRIANQNATHEQVVGACKKASIHDFIMTLPQGYDTPVGELGSTLSGGERQRLGVARAFLHDAPYILLDEPTSNLDSLNEAVILKSLAEERKDKTVVLVSHRTSTMRIADRTYSVENGRMS